MDALIEELKTLTGLRFDHYQRTFLEKRIGFRMKNLNLDYYNDYINYIRENPVEIDLFLDKFTINYTYFFRNNNIYENFVKFIITYVKECKKKKLHIWSAPCATGDEPYSIAILLNELKNKNKGFPDYKIVASDIDSNALKGAREGIYGEYSVHETPIEYLKTYFYKKDTEIGINYIIKNEIKDKVEFIQEDIIKGHQKNIKYDVIFCRNFFIYINQFAREKSLRVLESHLFDGGLLILGGSEKLPDKNSCFETIDMKNRFYIKNLNSQNTLFRNNIYNRTKNPTEIKTPSQRQEKDYKDHTMDKEIKTSQDFGYLNEKSQEIFKNNSLEGRIDEKIQDDDQYREKSMMETEVRITSIEVNNGVKNNLYENRNNHLKTSKNKIRDDSQKSSNKNLKENLSRKEQKLAHQEKFIHERISYLDDKYKKLETKRKELKKLAEAVRKQEEEFKRRLEILEHLTKHVEQREILIEQKEKNYESKIKYLGDYARQVLQKEVQINGISENLIKNKEDVKIFEENRLDRISNPNSNREVLIPMGYYGLINCYDKNELATKFVIKGLGAGIALFLKDPVNNIFAVSHIILPSSSSSKQGYHLIFPHTFADTSVKDLYNHMLYNGANKTDIKALIVGGAKLFLDYDMTYQENIDIIKQHLLEHHLEIEVEDTGGLSEREVIYDTINDSLYVKKTWEFEYRKIL